MSRITEYEVAEVTSAPVEVEHNTIQLADIFAMLISTSHRTPTLVMQSIETSPVTVAPTRGVVLPAGTRNNVQVALQELVRNTPTVARVDVPRLAALATDAVTAAPAACRQRIEHLAAAVQASHGQVVADHVHAVVAATLTELNFDQASVRPESRTVRASDSKASRSLRVDVTCSPAGKVRIAAETDGCAGDSCRQIFEKLEAGLRSRGVRMATTFQRPKDRPRFAGVIAGSRAGR